MSSGIFAGFFCRMAAPISTSWALVDSAGPAVFEDLPSGTSLFIVILTCFNDLSNSVKTEVFIKMWRYVAVLRHCREYIKPCFVALKFSDGVWCYTFGFSIRFFEQYGHRKRHRFIRFAVSHFGQYTTNIAENIQLRLITKKNYKKDMKRHKTSELFFLQDSQKEKFGSRRFSRVGRVTVNKQFF